MPTVTIGDQTGATFTGSIDTEIYAGDPTTNFGTAVTFSISKYGDASDHRNVLLSFPGSTNITGPVTVSAASVFLYCVTPSGTATIDMFESRRTWGETQATWNIYSTGNNWGTAGARNTTTDRGATALTSTVIASTVAGYYEFTSAAVIAYVQSKINAGQACNFIFERQEAGNDTVFSDFESSESATATRRPYLSVTYTSTGSSQATRSSVMQALLRNNN